MAAKPYITFRVASVIMKLGILNFCLAHAWNNPVKRATRVAAAIPTKAPSSMGMIPASASPFEINPASTPLKATWEPTDRSISPEMITRHIP